MATASPDKIRKDLNELWTKLGEQTEQNHDGVLRACSLSLIVVTRPDDDLGPMLGELMHAHPARAIVVSLAPDAAAPLDAHVQADCWLPFGGRQQICCERIEVSSGLGAVGQVPTLVRALTAPDLPVVIFHRGDHGFPAAALAELSRETDKVIIDSAQSPSLEAALSAIRQWSEGGRHVGDVGWTRLTRWRSMLAQFFDDPVQLARLDSISSVAVEWEGSSEPVSAHYLQAWLESALKRPLIRTAMRAGDCGRPRIKSVRLTGQGIDLAVNVDQDRSARFETDGQRRTTVMPALSECELLAEELSILGSDPVFDDVIAHLNP